MKILVSDTISKEGIELLKTAGEVTVAELTPEELLAQIHNYDALVVRARTKATKDVIEKAAKLKVIGRAGIGVDNIDVKTATSKKIPVVNAPKSSTTSVAELAIGLMIGLARMVPKADKSMKDGKWDKKAFMGVELYGKTLGLIGMGRIGIETAKRAHAFGMNVIAYSPHADPDEAKKAGIPLVALDTVLKESDFVSLHTKKTPENAGMLNAEALAKMKPKAFLVNCARGGIVDEAALYAALKDKKIAGAALDVFATEPLVDSPLVTLDNVILSPHIGASTKEAQERAGVQVAEQILKVLKGEKPDACVNKEVLK